MKWRFPIFWCLGICAAASRPAEAAVPDQPHVAGPTWSESAKAAQRDRAVRLAERFRAAVTRGDRRFLVLPGDYRFDGTFARDFVLANLTDFTFDATGATFWFDPHFGVRLRDCRGVTLKGLTIDSDPLPWLQGKITALDPVAQSMEFEPEPGYLFPVPGDFGLRRRVLFFDSSTGHELFMPDERVQELGVTAAHRVLIKRFVNNGAFQGIVFPRFPAVGDQVVINDERMNGGNLGVHNCSAVVIEAVTVYASANFAFHEESGAGGNIYRGCRLIRRPNTNRLMASRGDAFHSTLMERGPLVEGCEISSAGDDLLDVQGFFGFVLQVRGRRDLVVGSPFGQIMRQGSILQAYRLPEADALGQAQVVTMESSHDAALLAEGTQLPATLAAERKIRIRKLPEMTLAVVHLDRDLEVHRLDIIGCDDFCGAGAIIRNNYLHDGHIRGILVKSHHTLIENNVVERTAHSGIALEAELYWVEGPFNTDAQIKGNRLIDNGWGAFYPEGLSAMMPAIDVGNYFGQHISPRLLTLGMQNRSVWISDNEITRPAGFPIWIRNTEGVEILHNRIERPFAAGRHPDFFDLGKRLNINEEADSPSSAEVLRSPDYAILLQNTRQTKVAENQVSQVPSWYRGLIGSSTLRPVQPTK